MNKKFLMMCCAIGFVIAPLGGCPQTTGDGNSKGLTGGPDAFPNGSFFVTMAQGNERDNLQATDEKYFWTISKIGGNLTISNACGDKSVIYKGTLSGNTFSFENGTPPQSSITLAEFS